MDEDLVIIISATHIVIFCSHEEKIKMIMDLLDDYSELCYEKLITIGYSIYDKPANLYNILYHLTKLGGYVVC